MWMFVYFQPVSENSRILLYAYRELGRGVQLPWNGMSIMISDFLMRTVDIYTIRRVPTITRFQNDIPEDLMVIN